MIENRALLDRQFKHGKILLDIAEAVLHCIQPKELIAKAVSLRGKQLRIVDNSFDISMVDNIIIVGAGKATLGMAQAIHEIIGNHITSGYINVPETKHKRIGKIIVNQAGHPFPTASGQSGAKKIMDMVSAAGKNDLVICLISGGGSSLLPLPLDGITLKEKVSLTKRLMKKGADIFELNAVRKHISAIKGGRLAAAAAPATVVSLIMSDVLGDELDVIASGPTVPDTSTRADALEVLDRYQVGSNKIRKVINEHETPKKFKLNKVSTHVIGNNHVALKEVEYHAKKLKLNALMLTSSIRGEAKDVAQVLTAIAQEVQQYNRPIKTPALIIAGGETTVTVSGPGHGGRNQELVLAAVPHLNKQMSILSLATDGVDGITPTPVAGAIADGGITEQCVIEGVNYNDYLFSNDSFNCLQQLGCLLHTGPTGTNVGDIIMIFVK